MKPKKNACAAQTGQAFCGSSGFTQKSPAQIHQALL
jgi:hypothetical protein